MTWVCREMEKEVLLLVINDSLRYEISGKGPGVQSDNPSQLRSRQMVTMRTDAAELVQ